MKSSLSNSQVLNNTSGIKIIQSSATKNLTPQTKTPYTIPAQQSVTRYSNHHPLQTSNPSPSITQTQTNRPASNYSNYTPVSQIPNQQSRTYTTGTTSFTTGVPQTNNANSVTRQFDTHFQPGHQHSNSCNTKTAYQGTLPQSNLTNSTPINYHNATYVPSTTKNVSTNLPTPTKNIIGGVQSTGPTILSSKLESYRENESQKYGTTQSNYTPVSTLNRVHTVTPISSNNRVSISTSGNTNFTAKRMETSTLSSMSGPVPMFRPSVGTESYIPALAGQRTETAVAAKNHTTSSTVKNAPLNLTTMSQVPLKSQQHNSTVTALNMAKPSSFQYKPQEKIHTSYTPHYDSQVVKDIPAKYTATRTETKVSAPVPSTSIVSAPMTNPTKALLNPHARICAIDGQRYELKDGQTATDLYREIKGLQLSQKSGLHVGPNSSSFQGSLLSKHQTNTSQHFEKATPTKTENGATKLVVHHEQISANFHVISPNKIQSEIVFQKMKLNKVDSEIMDKPVVKNEPVASSGFHNRKKSDGYSVTQSPDYKKVDGKVVDILKQYGNLNYDDEDLILDQVEVEVKEDIYKKDTLRHDDTYQTKGTENYDVYCGAEHPNLEAPEVEKFIDDCTKSVDIHERSGENYDLYCGAEHPNLEAPEVEKFINDCAKSVDIHERSEPSSPKYKEVEKVNLHADQGFNEPIHPADLGFQKNPMTQENSEERTLPDEPEEQCKQEGNVDKSEHNSANIIEVEANPEKSELVNIDMDDDECQPLVTPDCKDETQEKISQEFVDDLPKGKDAIQRSPGVFPVVRVQVETNSPIKSPVKPGSRSPVLKPDCIEVKDMSPTGLQIKSLPKAQQVESPTKQQSEKNPEPPMMSPTESDVRVVDINEKDETDKVLLEDDSPTEQFGTDIREYLKKAEEEAQKADNQNFIQGNENQAPENLSSEMQEYYEQCLKQMIEANAEDHYYDPRHYDANYNEHDQEHHDQEHHDQEHHDQEHHDHEYHDQEYHDEQDHDQQYHDQQYHDEQDHDQQYHDQQYHDEQDHDQQYHDQQYHDEQDHEQNFYAHLQQGNEQNSYNPDLDYYLKCMQEMQKSDGNNLTEEQQLQQYERYFEDNTKPLDAYYQQIEENIRRDYERMNEKAIIGQDGELIGSEEELLAHYRQYQEELENENTFHTSNITTNEPLKGFNRVESQDGRNMMLSHGYSGQYDHIIMTGKTPECPQNDSIPKSHFQTSNTNDDPYRNYNHQQTCDSRIEHIQEYPQQMRYDYTQSQIVNPPDVNYIDVNEFESYQGSLITENQNGRNKAGSNVQKP